MNVRRHHRRTWGALLLGLFVGLSLPAFGQLVYRIDSPSEIWRDQLGSTQIVVCCRSGGAVVQHDVEGAPATVAASTTYVAGTTVRLNVTGTYTETWHLRLRTTRQFHGGSASAIIRTSNTIPVYAINQRHVDIDTEPSTTSVQEQTPLRFTEGGGALALKSYAVKLSLEPTANVTMTVTSGDTGAVTVDTDSGMNGLQSTLTFTTTNWNTWQTVTAAAVDDTDFSGESVTITHTAVGGGYTAITGTTVTLEATVADDEAAEVLVDANPSTTTVVDAGPLVLNEDTARTGNYSVRLSRAPTTTATVALASDNATVTLSASSLTFTTTSWSTAQTVTASTTQDTDAADEAADVTHTASGGGYTGITRTLRVGVTDDERTGTDYDTDEDGLIEINSLAKLNAVRWDLNGDGAVSGGDQTNYNTAFPGASTGMGCPDGSDSNQTPDACIGYELTTDLDFDTDGSGSSWTEASGNLTCDANDSYYNGGSGWDPIGPSATPTDATHYNAVFEGNGHVIDNLCIDRTGRSYVGLFAALRPDAVVRSLGLTNAGVYSGNGWSTAPLAGQSWARIAATHSSGTVRAPGNLGGLVGVQQSGATMVASYSTAAVHCTNSGAFAHTGGLVGANNNGATIVASYATGAVTGACPANRKYGLTNTAGLVRASYWDTATSGIDDDADAVSPEGRTSNQLQAPTAYGTSGIYARWSRQDVDGDSVYGEPNDDDAWSFGSNTQYPALKFGGASASTQFADQPPSFGTGTVADMTLRGGEAITSFQIPAATHSGAITYTATGLPSGLSFDADATGTCSAARTICGTPAVGTFAVAIYATDANGKSGVLRFTLRVLPVGIAIDTDPSTADTVDAGPLALVDEAGHASQSETYAVRLTAPATGDVTVTVTSADTGAVTVDTSTASGLQSMLTFTTTSWNTWQTVTAAAVPDADSTDESVTVSHAGSGGGYAGISESLTVEVTDALGAAITTSPSALTAANLNGATVTVTLTGATFVSGVTASSFSLTGAISGLNILSVATVSAGDTTATLTLAFSGDLTASTTFAVVVAAAAHSRAGALTSNTVTVAARPGVVFAPASLALTEGASGTYTVALKSAPSASVTVNVTSNNAGVTVDTSTASGVQTALTFTTTSWSTAQTVTATAATDADSADETATLAHATSGGGYGITANLVAAIQDPDQTGTDYDTDEDGFIEIDSLAKLHAMRWDRDGNGSVTGGDAANYQAAFPNAATGMGCPDGPDANTTPDACNGYELTSDLDFDTNDDGSVDSADDYWNDGAGWAPIHYSSNLRGNGHIIYNLYVSRDGDSGLFSELDVEARIYGFGLVNVNITGTGSHARVGGLVGVLDGQGAAGRGVIAAVFVTGVVNGSGGSVAHTGGLIGRYLSQGFSVRNAYTMARVTRAGGYAGGLMGTSNHSNTRASMSRGTRGPGSPQPLFGRHQGGSVDYTYWDSTTHGTTSDNRCDACARPTTQLQSPTGYTGIYLTWDDHDVDSDGVADDAWDFGTDRQYPVLKYGGFDTNVQFMLQAPSFGTGTVSDQTGSAGTAITAFQIPPASHPGTVVYTVEGLPAGLVFDVDGSGSCGTALQICGTPTAAGTFTVTVRVENTAGGRNIAGASTSLSFDMVIAGVEIDANPATTAVTDPGPLVLAEYAEFADNTRDYAVRLTSQPTASVTVTVTSADTGAATVDTDAASGLQSTLTFTATSWNTWQTVTAAAVQDSDFANETVSVTHAASGGDFNGRSSTLTVEVLDDEVAEVLVDADTSTTTVVDAGPLLLDEDSARTGNYSVRLSRAPSAAVTVALASDNPAVTLSAGALTFTTTSWATAQTVTATTTADTDAADEAADVTHTASGGGYGGREAILRVGVTDDERAGTDYDTDEDGLIEIDSLAQLNAIRWDLDGDGRASGNASGYATAFPSAANGMGCPDDGDADQLPDPCHGYELTSDLDFDTDDSGFTWTESGGAITGDANDDYDNGGLGWDPLGPASSPNNNTHFNAVFDGNGHVISNLFINRARAYTGLFAALRPDAVVRNLGLSNALVHSSWSTAPLAGQNWGRVAAVWATGAVRAPGNVGGLVGVQNAGATIVASYSMAAVECTDTGAFAHTGSLVGANNNGATVAASYGTGAVTGACPTNRKYGLTNTAGTVRASYWDTTTSAVADDGDSDPPEGRTTTQLQTPTQYGASGLYTTWNDEDVDGDGAAGGVHDDAWDFGTNAQYPVLTFAGTDPGSQRSEHPPSYGTTTVSQQTGRTGVSFTAFQVPAATHPDTITYTATGLPDGLSFDGDGSGACSMARAICGTPTRAGTYTITISAANAAGASVSISFTLVVGGIEIDADPATTPAVEAGPLALEESAVHATNSDTYAVRLTSAPNASVTVTVTSGDTAAVTVDTDAAAGLQSTLTFTTTNWSAWQTVTAQAVQDTDAYDESVTLTHAASGGGYNGVSAPLTATVNDDEPLEVLVDANPSTAAVDAGPLVLNEASTLSDNYAVTLSAVPSGTVTVTLASDNPAVTLSASALTFTTTSWATAQTVTATTTTDADAVDEASDVTHMASGGDYDGVSATLRVGVTDNDRTGTDYDTDEDGLIEINTLAQLNAVRWDLDGTGLASVGNAGNWATAFPGASYRGGCPDGGDSNQDADPCKGYELARDLDFDTDNSGFTWTESGGTITGDANDAYDNGGMGWDPLGPASTPNNSTHFNAVFDGNGHVIRNLFINRTRSYAGLFAALRPNAVVRNLGLPGALVRSSWSAGPLTGQNWGRVAAVWSSGAVRAPGNVGGLVGVQNSGATIVASYSMAAVECTDSGAFAHTGGLVGANNSGATIAASYSIGTVTGACPTNRKYGLTNTAGTVVAGYWDTTASGIDDDNDADPPEGRTTLQLQTPTAYGTTGIYALWDDQDVDGDGFTTGFRDDAWDFGTDAQYPALKVGGANAATQRAVHPPSFGTQTVTQQTGRTGVTFQAFQVPAAAHSGTLTYTASGLPPGLSFDGDGSGDCSAMRTICGTPTRAGTFTVTISAANANGQSASLSFTLTVGGIEIDADPDSASTVEAGPLALEEHAGSAAHSDDYAVRLTSAPSLSVTVTVTSDDTGAATVDTDAAMGLQSTLTFTTTNWNNWQTVTAQAVQDADFGNESVTITHSASGGGYDNVSAQLQVTVDDDEVVEVFVDADPATTTVVDDGPLLLDEDAARTGNYAVTLSAPPTAPVTVALASDNPAVTLSASALTFTTSNWAMAQTVTAMTTQDGDAADEAADVTHTASGGGYDSVTATLRVGVADDERTGTDYDTDEDGLIEINTLAQLNAVRWDLDADGDPAASNAASYNNAFPGASTGMGCPDGSDADQTPDDCIGYELTRDLDFDTDGDGSTYTLSGITPTGDSGDTYYINGEGWYPIGPSTTPTDSNNFTAVFDGNGHSIYNLFVNRNTRAYAGLFAALRPSAVVRNLGLPGAYVQGGWSTAALAGQSWGRVAAVWASGTVRGTGNVGGLVGVQQSSGTIVASYATAPVNCSASSASAWAGGLVGESMAGGTIAASYATGAVTGACPANRKFGLAGGSGAVTASYWDTTLSSINDDGDDDPPEGRTTTQMQAPTSYADLYSAWNGEDVDGDGVAGESNQDDAWDFGASSQHPVLKVGGHDTRLQFNSQGTDSAPSFGTGSVTNKIYRKDEAIAQFQVPAATSGNGPPVYSVTGLPAGLEFDVDGSGTCGTALAICGTPTTNVASTTVTVTVSDHDDNTGDSDTLTFTIGVVTASASISATNPAALNEGNLNNATVTVTLTGTTFGSGVAASNFTLGGTVPGVQVSSLATVSSGDTTATLTLSYSGTNFDNQRTLSVTVAASALPLEGSLTTATVNVAPTRAVVLSTASLNVNEQLTATYTVALGSIPTGAVTVAITGAQDGISVDLTSLAFTASNWSTGRTVTVSAADDQNSTNEQVTLTHTASGADYGSVTATLSVTALDNDTPSLRVDPTALTVDEGTSGAYTLRLNTLPTATVTVTVGGAASGVTVDTSSQSGDQSTLTFTATSWETEQTVTVRAGEDDNGVDETVSLSHGASGGNYGTLAAGARPGVTVRTDDNDTPAVVIDANPATATVDEAGPQALKELAIATDNSLNHTVRLATEPTADVTVAITSADTGAVTVGTSALTFTANNWDTGQTVALTAAQDADGVNESVVVTHAASTASMSEYTNVSATITATVEDDEAPALVFDSDTSTPATVDAAPLNLDELAGSTTNSDDYSVRLSSQPTQDVTVTVSSPDTGAVTVGASTLTFTTANWRTAQTVTATAAQDLDGADESVDVSHAAGTATNSEYTGITGDFEVAVDDDETPAITLSPTSLNVNEELSAAYTVALATQPTGAVTVAITGAGDGISINVSSLAFSASNWATARTVTVSAADDQNSANEQVTLRHTAGGAAEYGALTADLQATALDNDTPSLRVDPTSLTVPEADSRTYTVRLNTQPSATVTVTVSGAGSGVTVDTDSATGDQNTLTFTATSWETEQTVAVSAAADDNGVDEVVALSHAAAGGDYGTITGAALPGVSVTADDDDMPAVVIDANPATDNVDEPGPQALKELAVAPDNSLSHTVRLATEPTADVTVAITSADTGAVTVGTSALTFTANNWDTSQTVALTAAQDDDGVHESVVVTHAASTASMSEYSNVSATITATVEDDETPGFVFDADTSTPAVVDAAPLNLDEMAGSGANSDGYSVRLAAQPTQDVTVTVSSPDTGAVTVGASTLTFTTTNWSMPQTVTATAQQDDDGANESVDVAHTASTATSSEYTGVTGDFEVAVDDDETPGITLSPASLTVGEQDSSTYTVVLDTEPAGGNGRATVTVTGVADGITASPTRLVFGASNWDTARTVRVRAADDQNSVNEVVTLSHAGSGADYGGVSKDLEVTAQDNDTPSLRVRPTALTVREDGSATYRIRLNTEPSAAVTVTVGGTTAEVTVDADRDTVGDQTSLTFTDANWRAERTVAVSAAPDDDATDEVVNLTHAATGGDYTGLLLTARPGVSVTVDDDDEPAVLIDADPVTTNEDEPGPLALNELSGHPDNSKGYTVRLATEPTAQVEVAVTSGDRAVAVDTDQTPRTRTLTFTTTNWAMPQTVTATAAEDPDASNERVEIAHAADGGDYGGVSARLFATTVDDDEPALVVDAAALVATGVAEGGSAIYTVRLETEPAGVAVVSIAVTGGVSVDADGDQAGLQRTLRFDAANWNVARTVLVRGLEDDDAAAGMAALRHTSSGADYGRAQAVDVAFAVNDDDTPAVVVDQTAVAVNEGASAAYLVMLATAPSGGAVTVALSSSDAAAATVSPAVLRFTAGDWERPRRVTVRGEPDVDSTDGLATVSHSVSGGDYGAVTASPVAVAVRDSEAAGVRVEPPRLTVREGGTGRYRVRLNTEPTGDVTVTATGGAELAVDNDGTPQERSLTFTTGNWGAEQSVTVEAARDDGAEDGSLTVSHTVSGYAGVSTAPALQVQVEDGDEPGFTFDPEGGLSLSEEPADPADAMGAYTVRLATQPSGAVAVEVSSDDAGVEVDTDGTPRTLSLSFDASNWATGQSVSVRAVADADQVGETASLLHTAAGGGYGGVSGTLRVRVADDDRPPAPPPPPPPPPENRPPVVVGSLSDLDLDVGESTSVRLGGVFADDGPLSHWAESSDGSVASARVEGNSMLQVSGLSPGAATVTVWAADVEGQRAQLSFRVSVGRVLSFDPASASAPEGGTLRLRLSLSRPAGEALSVSWTALPDGDAATADADAADVSALSGTAEFAAGRTEAFIELEVRDDAEVEPAREVLRVELSPPPEGANWALGRSWALLWVEEGVCDRSPVVRDALRGSRECSAPTSSDLSGRGYLGLHRLDLPALRPKDFLGLSGLRVLHLHGNLLPELPAGLFEGLASLERLRLDANRLPTLPEGMLAGLGRLSSLRLDGNRLASLPAGLLSGAPNLERLDLGGNLMESLPAGLFVGAAGLEELNLTGNSGAPFALVMRLIRTDAEPWAPGPARVSAQVDEGAPFAFRAVLLAENAEPSAESVSVPAGETSGAPLSVAQEGPGAARLSLADGPALPATLCGDVQDGRRPCFRGLSVQAGPALLLFKPPPSPTDEPPMPALSADGDRASLALGDLFSPAEAGDRLTYEAESDRPDLLSVRIADGRLLLEANEDGDEGSAVVIVTATDPDGQSASLSLTVQVEYAPVGTAPSWRLEWIRTLLDTDQ